MQCTEEKRIYDLLAKKAQEKNEAIDVREGSWKVIGGRGKKRIVFSKKWWCNTQGVFKLVIFKLYYIVVTDLIYLMIHVQTVTMPTMFEKTGDFDWCFYIVVIDRYLTRDLEWLDVYKLFQNYFKLQMDLNYQLCALEMCVLAVPWLFLFKIVPFHVTLSLSLGQIYLIWSNLIKGPLIRWP